MRILIAFLLYFYYPFLVVLCLVMVLVLIYLASLVPGLGILAFALLPVAGVVVITLWQVLSAARVLFGDVPDANELELSFPRGMLKGLYDLTALVARQQQLNCPDKIRLSADEVAYVYVDGQGEDVLVIGGLAIRAFSQKALAGIVAHELAHLTAGDTRLSRLASRRILIMELLDHQFKEQSNSQLNPLVWMIHLYHLLFRLVQAAHSRQQEYAADQYTVDLVGKDTAGAALVRMSAVHRIPYLRLSSIVEIHVMHNTPLDQLFAEQEQRARSIYKSEWQEAIERELQESTGLFDSHPALRERLKAIGVSARDALELVAEDNGTPARKLLPAWEEIERRLTERLLIVYQEAYATKRELAQIMLGRPLSR